MATKEVIPNPTKRTCKNPATLANSGKLYVCAINGDQVIEGEPRRVFESFWLDAERSYEYHLRRTIAKSYSTHNVDPRLDAKETQFAGGWMSFLTNILTNRWHYGAFLTSRPTGFRVPEKYRYAFDPLKDGELRDLFKHDVSHVIDPSCNALWVPKDYAGRPFEAVRGTDGSIEYIPAELKPIADKYVARCIKPEDMSFLTSTEIYEPMSETEAVYFMRDYEDWFTGRYCKEGDCVKVTPDEAERAICEGYASKKPVVKLYWNDSTKKDSYFKTFFNQHESERARTKDAVVYADTKRADWLTENKYARYELNTKSNDDVITAEEAVKMALEAAKSEAAS